MKSKITATGVELVAETTEESFSLMFLLDVKRDKLFRSRVRLELSDDVRQRAYYGSNEVDIKVSNNIYRSVV
jgi:hypothetical protein